MAKMITKSELEIERWKEYKEKYLSGFWKGGIEKYKIRLTNYLNSLILAREYLETVDSFLTRKNLTEFYNWSLKEIKEIINSKKGVEKCKNEHNHKKKSLSV